MILVLGEGIIFLLGVSAGRRLHTKKERGENRSYLAEFRYFVDRRMLKNPMKRRKQAGPEEN